MPRRLAIHVLDDDHGRRAQIARCAIALGHHAEVYSDPAELAAHAPRDGLVIALEDAVQGGVSGLLGLLNREGRWLAVIATSANPTIDKAVAAIRQGALDYLPLPLQPQRLAQAIGAVAEESETIHAERSRQVEARALVGRLSPREREVVGLMAAARTNKEIGRELGISPRTVEIHRTNALAKLGVGHSIAAVTLFRDAGSGAATGFSLPGPPDNRPAASS
jgi:RNA polymerase sigma factor (sigma-70 family)